MTISGVLILIISLCVVPFFIGSIINPGKNGVLRTFVYGYLIEWSLFFPTAVLLIVRHQSLGKLCRIYLVILTIVSVAGIVRIITERTKKRKEEKKFVPLSKSEIIYLGIFFALVAFQMYKTLFYAYADGDDAFYIATAQAAAVSDKMYLIEPYLGIALDYSQINYRYALAPFPMWLAFLTRISGINVATVAHVFVPVVLIEVTYIIYNEISRCLFKDSKEKRYIFLTLSAVFVMFANVSTSTAETFLLTRARQGKEALANIALPMLFLLLFEIHEKLEENSKKVAVTDILMLMFTALSAALMSVFGSVLFGIAIIAFLIILLFEKRSFRVLFDIAISAVPSGIAVLMYLILG